MSKHIKDLSERFTPTVAVASAVLPITNDLATQFALPSKDKLIRTAARTRKQLELNMPPIPVARNFEILENFENFIRFNSGSNDHERIILCGDPEMLRVLEKSSFWLADFGIQSYFSGAHPNMWKVVGSLQKDASVQNSTFLMHRVAISSQKRKSIEY